MDESKADDAFEWDVTFSKSFSSARGTWKQRKAEPSSNGFILSNGTLTIFKEGTDL